MKLILKRIVALALLVCLFLGCGRLLRYLLVDDTTYQTRVMMHDFYNTRRNIDVAFVGSSHVKRSFSPAIIDEKMGCYSFNLGSANQGLDDSFAMIKELCARNRPDTIYLEIYYRIFLEDYRNKESMTQTFILSDYMKPSLRKLEYIFSAVPKNQLANALIPARRKWKKLFDFDYIVDLVKKKRSDMYVNYHWDDSEGLEYYVERGFFACDHGMSDKKLWNDRAYGKIKGVKPEKHPEACRLLADIINYCRRRGVKIVLVSAPQPEWTIVGRGNYQKFIDMMRDLAGQNGVEYYDFNLVRPEHFDTSCLSYFRDFTHLSTSGAETFSRVFGDFFGGKLSREQVFYSSMADKLADEAPRVYGLAYEKKKKRYKGYMISNRSEGVEYSIVAHPKDGEEYVVKAYSEDPSFEMSAKEKGKLTLYWRLTGQPETEQSVQSTY